MNKHIISLSLLSCSALISMEDPNASSHSFGYAGNQIKVGAQILQQTVLSTPKVAGEVGEKLVEGALKKFDKEKQKELASNLLRGAMDELSSAERQQLAYDWAKGSLEAAGTCAVAGATAAATSAKAAITAKATATAAGAKATIAAGLASPAAPFVIGGVVIGGTVIGGGYGAYKYREGNFRRCLNRNFGESLNEEGFPQRCESPARRLSWWSAYQRDVLVGRYKVEREGVVKKGSQ